MASEAADNIKTHVNLLAAYGFDKKWNGIPMYHFSRIWFQPFLNACGQISVDGASLKDRFLGIDPGSDNGPIIRPGLQLANYNGVPQVHASDAQMRQMMNRNRRLYAVVLSHIEASCYFYSELETDYANNGRAAALLVQDRGVKPFAPEKLAEMEADWMAMTCVTLRIKIDEQTAAFLRGWAEDTAMRLVAASLALRA